MGAQAKLELILEMKNKLTGGFGKAKQFVNSELKAMSSKVDEFKDKITSGIKDAFNKITSSSSEAFAAIKNEIPGVGRAIELLKNPYVLAAAGAVAFASFAFKATNMALDWERSLSEVNVTAQLGKKDLGDLSNTLLMIGAKGSTDLEDVPKAFNRIISAGLDVNTSLKALDPTLKAAKAGFTDVETVAAAGIGVMTSSGEEINKVYDILFATLNKGNVKFQEIANYLPKIIPGAKNAGFSLAEVGGAFAFLTAKGQTAEATTTGLANTFKAFSKPETIKGFKAIGVDIFDANRNTKPFIQIIKELSGVLSKTGDKESFIAKFSEIGLDQDAVAAVATMIQNVDDLKSTIDFTTNSTGQLDEAVKNARTSTDGWKEGVNKAKVLMIQFGQLFLPLVSAIGEGFNWVMEQIMGGVQAVKDLYNQSVLLQDIVSVIAFAIVTPFKILGSLFGFIVDAIKWLDAKLGIGSAIGQFFKNLETSWIIIKALGMGTISVFAELFKILAPIGEALANISNPAKMIKALGRAKDAFKNFNLSDTFNKGFKDSLAESLALKKSVATTETVDAFNPKGVSAGETAPNVSSGTTGEADSTVKAGVPNKQIIINVDALHKGNNVITQSGDGEGMSIDELERKMNEIWLRLLRNSNAAF